MGSSIRIAVPVLLVRSNDARSRSPLEMGGVSAVPTSRGALSAASEAGTAVVIVGQHLGATEPDADRAMIIERGHVKLSCAADARGGDQSVDDGDSAGREDV